MPPIYTPLSQLDRTFLLFESPEAPMHVGAVEIFDAGPLETREGGIDVDRIREYTASRLHRLPRYRQRLASVPIEGHPIWVDDERFNLTYHVRHTRLPAPGDERALKRVVGRVASQQLDRGKPLWEMWVVEGLEGGRFALIQKVHHCMVDGISGVDLLTELTVPEPTATIETPPAWIPTPAPGGLGLLAAEAWRRARAPLGIAPTLWRLARGDDETRRDVAERARAAARLAETVLRNASSTPLNQPVGPHRRVDWATLDLDAVRAVKHRLGGTVNDVVLATAAGALRRFLEQRHVDVRELDFRVMAPVSLRTPTERGTLGNRVSAWFVQLPLGEADALRRYQAIRRTTAELKASRQVLGAETWTEVSAWTGTTVLALVVRLARWGRPFNLVVTNVPGPQMPLYLLGARMREVHPIVPLFGNLATGIALMSYAGRLHWGVAADWDAVPDLHRLVAAIGDAFQELVRVSESAGARLPAAASGPAPTAVAP